jgi:hypothetical protein
VSVFTQKTADAYHDTLARACGEVGIDYSPPTSGSWDPTPAERSYYRSRIDGSDVGWLVRRGGKDFIRLNVPQDTNLRPFRPDDWISEKAPALLMVGATARIAYEAHRALMYGLHHHKLGRKEWVNLQEETRMKWIAEGPKMLDAEHAVIAQGLYKVIMEYLAQYTR